MWGPAATLGWASLMAAVNACWMAVFASFGMVCVIIWFPTRIGGGVEARSMLLSRPDPAVLSAFMERNLDALMTQVGLNGFLTSVFILVSALLLAPLALLSARLRRGEPVRDYLGLHSVPFAAWGGAFLLGSGLETLMVWLRLALGWTRPLMEVQAQVTEQYIPGLLLLATVVVHPLVSELIFRGFLFRGLAESKHGERGAVAATTLLFGGYVLLTYGERGSDALEVAYQTLLGFLLGGARMRTGSILPCAAMHAAGHFVRYLWGLPALPFLSAD